MACALPDNMPKSSVVRLAEELTEVTSLYPEQCVTDYSHNELLARVLFSIPNDCLDGNTTVIVNLKRGYPHVTPEFLIQSKTMSKSDKKKLTQLLKLKSQSLIGQPMLCDLITEFDHFCAELRLQMKDPCTEGQENSVSSSTDIEHMLHKNDNCKKKESGCAKTENRKERRKKPRRKRGRRYDSDDSEELHSDTLAGEGEERKEVDLTKTPSTLILRDDSGTLLTMPTHFIAIRFTDASILQGLSEVQQCLVEKEPLLGKGVFTTESLHMTVCTLGLDIPAQVTHCINTLEKIKPDLIENWPQQPLTVHSMSQFYNRAIYAKVKCGTDFHRFRNYLRKRLLEFGVEVRDEHEGFTPHITIIKVKRPERRLFGTRNIQPSIYAHVLDRTFGHETINAIYLCTMGGQRREDGFYVTEFELHV